MMRRIAVSSLLAGVLAGACGVMAAACTPGPRGDAHGPSSSSAAPPDKTVSFEWLEKRPIVTPWGPGEIPATKKPHWFCFTDIAHPENSICHREEGDCIAARGRDKCEPHARGACHEALGACYPTIAICEGARLTAARDQGSSRAKLAEHGACAWQD